MSKPAFRLSAPLGHAATTVAKGAVCLSRGIRTYEAATEAGERMRRAVGERLARLSRHTGRPVELLAPVARGGYVLTVVDGREVAS